MPISPYLKKLRELVGSQLLMLPAVCAIVFNKAGEVLLQDRRDGRWHTIGGIIEPGEQPAEACIREVLEETGLTIIPETITGVYNEPEGIYPNGDKVQYTSIVFKCKISGGTLSVADDESIGFQFFSPDDLPTLSEIAKRKISDAVAFQGTTAFMRPEDSNRKG
jgi:8-oxo-dGTP diphosphatase